MSADDFRIVAIIAARNEADVIPQLLDDLTRQNVSAYLIDDGSSDDTVAVASRWLQRGLLGIERRPDTGTFQWSEILRRKEELAMELPATWFIHQDADEFHESPWPHLNLRDGIQHVDALGYNAIDFKLMNFIPTDADAGVPDDVRTALRYYEAPRAWDAIQIKCWKNTGVRVDLHSSGGHAAEFEGRMVCPIAFLTRHYPIRSQAHGVQKVLRDRLPRFSPEERGRGWHIQYDDHDGRSFVRDAGSLALYDPVASKKELMTSSWATTLVAQHAAELARLRQQHSDIQRQFELSTNKLAEAHRELRQCRQASEEARQAAKEAGALADETRRSLEAGMTTLAAELRSVYGSHSWRVSAPLRAIYGWLLKAGGRG